mgnify:CR=1 FL=1
MSALVLWSGVVLIGTLFLYRIFCRGASDAFHPLKVFALLTFVETVPYLIYHSLAPLDVHPDIMRWMRGDDFDYYLSITTITLSMCVLALYAGFHVPLLSGSAGTLVKYLPRDSELTAVACWLSVFLGVTAYIATIEKIGGVGFLIENMSGRANITAGFGYEFTFAKGLMILGALGLFFNAAKTHSKVAWGLACLAVFIVFILLAFRGGRKDGIFLVVMCLFVANYATDRRRRITGLLVAGSVIAFGYFVGVLAIRQRGVLVDSGIDLVEFGDAVSRSFGVAAKNVSYLEHYAFAMYYFERFPYWFGEQFKDLMYAFVPSSWYPDKPPVDDGVYLRSLAGGMVVEPGMAASMLDRTSWPPETLATGLSLAGVAGAALLFFVRGMVLRLAYGLTQYGTVSFAASLMVFHLIFNFEFSVLRIVNLVAFVMQVGVFFLLCKLTNFFLVRRSSRLRARGGVVTNGYVPSKRR